MENLAFFFSLNIPVKYMGWTDGDLKHLFLFILNTLLDYSASF